MRSRCAGALLVLSLAACSGPDTVPAGDAGVDSGDGAVGDAGSLDGASLECAVPDADGDGHASAACGGDDCDDADPNRFLGNSEVCDPLDHDEDCDPTTYGARDGDGDGDDDALCCNVSGDGTRRCGDDCDDTRPNVHSTAPEACNGVDDDCDGAIDEGVLVTFYRDADGDLFGDPSAPSVVACSAPAGYVLDATDCDDAHDLVHPEVVGICNCTPSHTYDADGDGEVATACGGDDCDDTNAAFYPGAPGTCTCPAAPTDRVPTMGPETCDGRDEDCSGVVDDEPAAGAYCVTLAAHGTSACGAGACTAPVCDPGYIADAATCVSMLLAPRPIAPLSTATVTSRRPTFRWSLAAATDGARVEICADRACATVITTIDATSSAAPSTDLPAGVVFWRLFGRMGTSVGASAGPTWQLVVGARTAPVDTSWGTTLDVNGDGYADLAVGAWGASSETPRVRVPRERYGPRREPGGDADRPRRWQRAFRLFGGECGRCGTVMATRISRLARRACRRTRVAPMCTSGARPVSTRPRR